MESTEKCEVVIQHFNGKYLKTPPGLPGKSSHHSEIENVLKNLKHRNAGIFVENDLYYWPC